MLPVFPFLHSAHIFIDEWVQRFNRIGCRKKMFLNPWAVLIRELPANLLSPPGNSEGPIDLNPAIRSQDCQIQRLPLKDSPSTSTWYIPRTYFLRSAAMPRAKMTPCLENFLPSMNTALMFISFRDLFWKSSIFFAVVLTHFRDTELFVKPNEFALLLTPFSYSD